ncbi:MAG TPA: hypothetical protein VHA78_03440 [Candidatus Peribacteraceae bacterium]|nr:hypothetical protein [Candidatus Peribacteraceae bacterium]
MDGPENYGPGEGGEGGTGNVSEGVSEQAREQFAQAQAAIQQVRREERKAKKKDDGVAQVILQFLTDTQRTHLATLIARLVAIDCPSPFILAILSLISEGCRLSVDEFLQERQRMIDVASAHTQAMVPQDGLNEEANAQVIQWIMRMEAVLSLDMHNILQAIIVDETNIDGTVLQLATFVFQEFLKMQGKNAQFEAVQPLAINVLQSLFESPMRTRMEMQLQQAQEEMTNDE